MFYGEASVHVSESKKKCVCMIFSSKIQDGAVGDADLLLSLTKELCLAPALYMVQCNNPLKYLKYTKVKKQELDKAILRYPHS